MSENPTGVPAAADNPMAAQHAPAAVASTEGVDVAAIEEALRDVIDPELGINVVDLGLLYGVSIEPDGTVVLDMTLTTAACPLTDVIEEQAQQALSLLADKVRIQWVWLPPWGPDKITPEGREQLRALGFNV
ncbi:metal-sulfur cluster assembly factor [Actinomyces viscosus]|uniref:FeS assembly SUF system protein n=1 Tax=Actinomyces viscosus TaxID=1656 RepID=A0A3S4VDE1_ACTVI|nr:metal-sulfur cluster assembly factor [Actinomyces viscosus]TFH52277.1 metal-sulfur cluster assembly factor [Actinomyces viscosus]VEI15082.1 FeS assembly SUF system protein [Actinomyces viscosus]